MSEEGVVDVVKEAGPDEHYRYVAAVRRHGVVTLMVVVPAEIARRLGLRPGDLVEVTVRRATEGAVRELGVYKGPKRVPQWRRVRCPKCGREGAVFLRRLLDGRGVVVYVRHSHTNCYICSVNLVEARAPELKGIVERLLRGER